MTNENEKVKSGYLESRAEGEMSRNREQERNPLEDRRSRDLSSESRSSTTESNQFSRRRSVSDFNDTNNRGKGPRNYRRSDERIREIVCELFCDDPYLDASNMEVEVKNSVVFLSGSADDLFAKRLAEDLANSVSGIARLENHLRLKADDRFMESDEINFAVV